MKTKNLEPISECDLEARYDDFLDEVYGEVSIGGLNYMTSHALKEVDPTAYRCGFNDWLDSELGETIVEHDGEYYDKAEFDEANDDEVES